jgi:hypothetical protein
MTNITVTAGRMITAKMVYRTRPLGSRDRGLPPPGRFTESLEIQSLDVSLG